MPEGFLTGLHRNWFVWSGWLFTVGGTLFGFLAGGAYVWIGALVALAGLSAVTAFAYQLHRELREAENRHTAALNRLESELRTARERTEQAERKLHEVPADILLRLQDFFAANSFHQWVNYLLRHAEYVERMVRFTEQTATRPPSLRAFVSQSGSLYAVARIEEAAIRSLKDGDPFILTHKDAKGLFTDSARLVVHQRNEADGAVWFRVDAFLSDEMEHLGALAAKKDVAGLTGYSIRPACGVQNFASVNLANASEIVRALAEEIAQSRGFRE